ncbi:hypothetical protein COOONC_27696 [Cooperia oncophora]
MNANRLRRNDDDVTMKCVRPSSVNTLRVSHLQLNLMLPSRSAHLRMRYRVVLLYRNPVPEANLRCLEKKKNPMQGRKQRSSIVKRCTLTYPCHRFSPNIR